MKLKITPENFLERIALMFNLAPIPLIETQIYFIVARAIMAAAELNIFEALGKETRTYREIAEIAKTNPLATKHLLDCLTGVGYLKWDNERYSLKPNYYKWLLRKFRSNIIDKLCFQISEWNWMTNLESYVRTGRAMELHAVITGSEWKSYQDGMKSLSVYTAAEVAGKIRLSSGASQMLDIGGAHGLYSVELCKKYPGLSSAILELPAAIERVSAIKESDGLFGRVKYKAGDALIDNFGDQLYDLILLNNLAHHFTALDNMKLVKKAVRALKPGGLFAVGEFIRSPKPGEGGVIASSSGLYFSLTSKSGAWSIEEICSWQREAGLKVKKPITLRSLPGWQMLIAAKEFSRDT